MDETVAISVSKVSRTVMHGSSPLKVGFLGCGTIASAMATGLATQDKIEIGRISVTKRSEQKSMELKLKFPDTVHIFEKAQDVVDGSDLVFVTLLPQQTSEVLRSLEFVDKKHTLVSVVVR